MLDAAADLVDRGGAELDDMERVQHRGGVLELVVDRGLVAGERVKSCDLHLPSERVAAFAEPGGVGLPGAARNEVEQPVPRLPGAVAAQVDHAGQLLRAALAGVDVMPDVLVDAEGGDALEPGLIGREPHQFGFDCPPHRLPRRAELAGEAVDGGVLATQLPDRPADGALGDRSPFGDQGRQLLHERLPPAAIVVATPDALPPHDPHPRDAGNVMQHATAAPSAGRDDPARRAPDRRRRARDGHHQQIVAAVDMLDMHAVEAEQQVTAGTRASGRARVSAPRSRVKHVEVLGVDQAVSASDPRDLDPYPRELTRRASPPPDVRRATKPRTKPQVRPTTTHPHKWHESGRALDLDRAAAQDSPQGTARPASFLGPLRGRPVLAGAGIGQVPASRHGQVRQAASEPATTPASPATATLTGYAITTI